MTASPLSGTGGVLAKLAAVFAGQADFHAFLSSRWPESSQITTAHEATELIKRVCAVKSRKEFDNDIDAANRFHDLVRIPYVQWQLGRDVQA